MLVRLKMGVNPSDPRRNFGHIPLERTYYTPKYHPMDEVWSPPPVTKQRDYSIRQIGNSHKRYHSTANGFGMQCLAQIRVIWSQLVVIKRRDCGIYGVVHLWGSIRIMSLLLRVLRWMILVREMQWCNISTDVGYNDACSKSKVQTIWWVHGLNLPQRGYFLHAILVDGDSRLVRIKEKMQSVDWSS